jgi:hypothetical protein
LPLPLTCHDHLPVRLSFEFVPFVAVRPRAARAVALERAAEALVGRQEAQERKPVRTRGAVA